MSLGDNRFSVNPGINLLKVLLTLLVFNTCSLAYPTLFINFFVILRPNSRDTLFSSPQVSKQSILERNMRYAPVIRYR